MSEDRKTRVKRPRDEDFENERREKAKEQDEEDVFEKHKQNPLTILGIIGVGVLFAVVSLGLYWIFSGNQRTIINVVTSTLSEEAQTTVSVDGSSDGSEGSEKEDPSETTESTEETTTESPDYDYEAGGMVYRITNGYAALMKCKSEEAAVSLPATVDGYPLKAIWNHAFDGCTHLYYVKIPEGVWSIGEYAFANVGELKGIVFPASVRDIQPHCFDYTGGMTFISPAGCFAEQVAKASNINWVEGTELLYQ